jgi:hypothetical protein
MLGVHNALERIAKTRPLSLVVLPLNKSFIFTQHEGI